MGRFSSAVVFAASCAGVVDGLAALSAQVKNTSIVINGEPKSGTTWLEYVAKEVLGQGCTKRHRCSMVENADGRTYSAQMPSGTVSYDMSAKHTIPHIGHLNKFDFSHPPAMSDVDVELAARTALQEAPEGTKWLAIFRDPRDVTISSCYHMYKDCPNANGYVSSKIQGIAKWINIRHRFFLALRKLAPEKVHMLYYEEMRKDELGTIKGLARFFGMSINRRQVRIISSHTTFSTMREKPKDQVAQGGAASGKVREGASCGYSKELTEDAAQRVTKTMRASLSAELNAKWQC